MPIFQKFFLYLLSIFHPSFFEKQFIYLAAPGLSLGAQDLLSLLRHAGYLVVACGVQFPAAAAAAKSRQSCPTLCDPIDSSPPGSRPWDSPGKNTGVGCHFLLQCMKVKSESEVAQSCLTLPDPMDCSLPGSSVHGILQARVLEWGAIAFSVGINQTQAPCIASMES